MFNNICCSKFSTKSLGLQIGSDTSGFGNGFDIKKSDVNGDGILNVVDLYILSSIVVGNIPVDNLNFYDLNGDDKVNSLDILILKSLLSSKFY